MTKAGIWEYRFESEDPKDVYLEIGDDERLVSEVAVEGGVVKIFECEEDGSAIEVQRIDGRIAAWEVGLDDDEGVA